MNVMFYQIHRPLKPWRGAWPAGASRRAGTRMTRAPLDARKRCISAGWRSQFSTFNTLGKSRNLETYGPMWSPKNHVFMAMKPFFFPWWKGADRESNPRQTTGDAYRFRFKCCTSWATSILTAEGVGCRWPDDDLLSLCATEGKVRQIAELAKCWRYEL